MPRSTGRVSLIPAEEAAKEAEEAREKKQQEKLELERERRAAELEETEQRLNLAFPIIAQVISHAVSEGLEAVTVTIPDQDTIDGRVKNRVCEVLREYGYAAEARSRTVEHGDSAAPSREAVFFLEITWTKPMPARHER